MTEVSATLTEAQREIATRLLPLAHGIARRWSRDEELISVSELALCQTILRWRPDGMPLDKYVKIELWRRISTAVRTEARRREVRVGDMSVFPARDEHEPILDCLPTRLLPLAKMYWLDGRTIEGVAEVFGLTRRETREKLLEAANYLRMVRKLAPIRSLT